MYVGSKKKANTFNAKSFFVCCYQNKIICMYKSANTIKTKGNGTG